MACFILFSDWFFEQTGLAKKMQVYLFAAAKDLAGKERLEIHVALPISVTGLKEAIAAACPNLKELVVHSRIAVDGQYVSDQATIDSANEVALIPPVSGG